MTISPTYHSSLVALSIDVVVIGCDGSALKVLLFHDDGNQPERTWSLPGTSLLFHETVEEAAVRLLCEETSARCSELYLTGVFSDPRRCQDGRVVSIAVACVGRYTADIDVGPRAQWHPIAELPSLVFDHRSIIDAGLDRLRRLAEERPIAANLIASPFTLSEFQTAQETLTGRPLDKRNFRRDLFDRDWLMPAGMERRGSHRPAQLFTVADAWSPDPFERSVGLCL